jgi:DNA-binding transcriptional ArsR family regulator
MTLPPILPYGSELPTSGWSGSESSRDRALAADASGLTSATQQTALELLAATGSDGITWAEMSAATGQHHGTVSGALSNLHKAGLITRLTERRGGSQIYVLPEHVSGRQEAPYRPNSAAGASTPAPPPSPAAPRLERQPVSLAHLAGQPVDRAAEAVWLGYRDEIVRAIAATPRSLQRRIGPSEIGTSCDRCLVEKLAGVREPERPGFAWLPFVGSAVHAALAEIFMAANDGQQRARYLVEQSVNVGEILGVPITGSADLYDMETAEVTDWKIVGVTTLAKVKAVGPGDLYRAQVHLYGRGMERRGLPVRRVRVAFLPRNETHLGNSVVWSEPYQESVAVEALDHASAIATGLAMVGLEEMRRMVRHNGLEFSCGKYDAALSQRHPSGFEGLVAS